ncbi:MULTISPECIES: lytic transglycosylase domain-containing protein [Trichocoleus]|uniref:Transglycosylase SLT domain-containing protein n=1 Tax=Trichocoleus desertorum GB2-A4 TaxID=2933944 RepID=A0ABV0J6M9_9CYAN|nr:MULTISPECIES: lytic transglycosylase domain-containing protein [unclassified Trichocoleus]MBD1863774.1 lytic transglycosylase domain-containing protein [Trichocoleus sp. FACHB-46]MBD2095319.1 lytic transglycosylase domain-containing protein [Trichocoleus sp. FACHB-591]MBD2121079.1 lytic transglycosylase domain-containing protein [Trichocoleus sp. FACHB-262]
MLKQWTSSRSLTAVTTLVVRGLLMGGLALPVVVPAAQASTYDFQVEPSSTTPSLPPQVIALRRAIIGQESGANFRAVNRHSGALGYGQVMPANIPSWTKEALGHSITASEFLNSPELQLQVIDFKLNQYWQAALVASNGDEAIAVRRVASHWYSGKPYRYNHTTASYYGGHRYPSVAEYTLAILQRYEQQKGLLGIDQLGYSPW